MMPPFVVFPTNRIAHFVEVSLYLFYLAQQVNLVRQVYAATTGASQPSAFNFLRYALILCSLLN